MKLKFGIEAILNPKIKSNKNNADMETSESRENLSPAHSDSISESGSTSTCNFSHERQPHSRSSTSSPDESKKNIFREIFQRSLADNEKKKNCFFHSGLSPTHSERKFQYNSYSPLKLAPNPEINHKNLDSRAIKQKIEPPKHHPYSPFIHSLNKKFQDEPTTYADASKITEAKQSNISHNLWKRDAIPSLPKTVTRIGVSQPGSVTPTILKNEHNFSDHLSPTCGNNETLNLRKISDSDDVFNENEHPPLSNKDLVNFWRQKKLSSRGMSSVSSPPSFVGSPEHRKPGKALIFI